MDNLGKCFGANLLRMEIEVADDLLGAAATPQTLPAG